MLTVAKGRLSYKGLPQLTMARTLNVTIILTLALTLKLTLTLTWTLTLTINSNLTRIVHVGPLAMGAPGYGGPSPLNLATYHTAGVMFLLTGSRQSACILATTVQQSSVNEDTQQI